MDIDTSASPDLLTVKKKVMSTQQQLIQREKVVHDFLHEAFEGYSKFFRFDIHENTEERDATVFEVDIIVIDRNEKKGCAFFRVDEDDNLEIMKGEDFEPVSELSFFQFMYIDEIANPERQ